MQRTHAGRSLAAVPRSWPGLAGEVELADDGGEQRVTAEVVLVVEVHVAQSQSVDPLGQELLDGVLDEAGVVMVGEAGGELAEQQGAAVGSVGSDVAAVEVGKDFAAAEQAESRGRWRYTVSPLGCPFLMSEAVVTNQPMAQGAAQWHSPGEKSELGLHHAGQR